VRGWAAGGAAWRIDAYTPPSVADNPRNLHDNIFSHFGAVFVASSFFCASSIAAVARMLVVARDVWILVPSLSCANGH
jgi:hypothetical protein